jgi:F420 biosynthesis protein FbiB-like protein
MDYHAFLRSRRSIRRFAPGDIADAAIERIIFTAAHAPSAHNRQPWRFYVLKRLEAKTRLADAMAEEFQKDLTRDGLSSAEVTERVQQSRSRIVSSPLVILLCLDMSEMDSYPDARRQEAEHTMAIQSIAAAGLQLLLAVHAEGLAGVWTCGPLFAPRAVRQALGAQSSWEPQAMFFVGRPDQAPREKVLKPLVSIMQIL